MKALKHIVCQISGSLDSAVSAFILKQKGILVTTVYVNNKLLTSKRNEEQFSAARDVAKHLSLPFKEINISDNHWNVLKRDMVSAYMKGGTPDIDVLYHKYITLQAAVDVIDKLIRPDIIATGHYARSVPGDETHPLASFQGVRLLKCVDQHHDDTLVLGQVPQKYLPKVMFPLGDFTKEVVHRVAENVGLQHFNLKTELISQEVQSDIIHKELPVNKGDIFNLETGEVLGEHEGVHHYTVGHPISIDGDTYLVSHKNINTNRITIVPDKDHPGLYTNTVFSTLANWVYKTPYNFYEKHTMPCEFRTHENVRPVRCILTVGTTNEWCGNDHVIVSSSEPIRAVTPGKFVAFYKGEECIGSASIMRPGPSLYAMDYQKYSKGRKTTKEWSPLKSIMKRLSWIS